jgi:hypothetical protein
MIIMKINIFIPGYLTAEFLGVAVVVVVVVVVAVTEGVVAGNVVAISGSVLISFVVSSIIDAPLVVQSEDEVVSITLSIGVVSAAFSSTFSALKTVSSLLSVFDVDNVMKRSEIKVTKQILYHIVIL